MKRLYSEVAGLKIGDGYPVRVIGIINISPESFYKGSVASGGKDLIETAVAMEKDGADMIDVGAMSTAPYKEAFISEQEEIARVKKTLKGLREAVSIPISIDTIRSSVAAEAMRLGADMVNDVTGLIYDPKMAKVVKNSGAALLVMAHESVQRKGTPIKRVGFALQESIGIAIKTGIDQSKIVVDPGIGFFRSEGKGPAVSIMKDHTWYEWDCIVMNELSKLRSVGYPIAIGVSRKSFIGKLSRGEAAEDRLPGSLSAAAACVLNGAHMIRAHDVAQTVQAVRVAEAIRSPGPLKNSQKE